MSSPSELMRVRWRQSELRNLLSNRQYEAVSLLAECKEVGEIARSLGIKPTTASTYLEQARNKLGSENNFRLLATAREVYGLGGSEGEEKPEGRWKRYDKKY